MVKPPDIYALDDSELAEELRNIEFNASMQWGGPLTIVTGVRRDQITGASHPVLILRASDDDALHLMALPGQ